MALNFDPRRLVGRRIVAFDAGAYRDPSDGRRWHYSPTITLDDGTQLVFGVSEQLMGDDYGVTPLLRKPRKASGG